MEYVFRRRWKSLVTRIKNKAKKDKLEMRMERTNGNVHASREVWCKSESAGMGIGEGGPAAMRVVPLARCEQRCTTHQAKVAACSRRLGQRACECSAHAHAHTRTINLTESNPSCVHAHRYTWWVRFIVRYQVVAFLLGNHLGEYSSPWLGIQ